MMECVLEVRNVSYWYEQGRPVLDQLNLTVQRGRRLAVLGSNGSGKSTLFLHLNGTLRPKRGEVLLHGQPVHADRHTLRAARQQISLVFQDPDDQILSPVVYQDVAYGPQNLGLSDLEVRRRVDDALDRLNISHLRNNSTHLLSFGQKKRVAIAGALAMQPDILVLDEPTAGLDPRGVRSLLEVLEDLHRLNTAVVLSTHDVDLAYEWADEVALIHEGKVLIQDEPDCLFQREDIVHACSLGLPWAYEIRAMLPPADDGLAESRRRNDLMKRLRRFAPSMVSQ